MGTPTVQSASIEAFISIPEELRDAIDNDIRQEVLDILFTSPSEMSQDEILEEWKSLHPEANHKQIARVKSIIRALDLDCKILKCKEMRPSRDKNASGRNVHVYVYNPTPPTELEVIDYQLGQAAISQEQLNRRVAKLLAKRAALQEERG
jgi:hypothetical protein